MWINILYTSVFSELKMKRVHINQAEAAEEVKVKVHF